MLLVAPSADAMRQRQGGRPVRGGRRAPAAGRGQRAAAQAQPARNLPLQIEILTRIAQEGPQVGDAELLHAAGYQGPAPTADEAGILAIALLGEQEEFLAAEEARLRAAQEQARRDEEAALLAELAAQRRHQERGLSPAMQALAEARDEFARTGRVAEAHIGQLLDLNVAIPPEFFGGPPAEPPRPPTPQDPVARLAARLRRLHDEIHQADRQAVLRTADNRVWDRIATLAAKAGLTERELQEFQHLQAHGIGTGLPEEGGRQHGWQFSRDLDRHRRLDNVCDGIQLVQLYSAPQGPNDCGTFGFANTASLAAALQLLGPNGINSAIIAHLTGSVAQRYQDVIPAGEAILDELDDAVKRLHTQAFLPIERGHATIGIETQHGAPRPTYAAAWDGGNEAPEIFGIGAFAEAEEGLNLARGLIARSLRQSSANGGYPGIVNFIINAGGYHWVAASVVQLPDGPLQMFYFDSKNNPPIGQRREALEYICRLVLEPLVRE